MAGQEMGGTVFDGEKGYVSQMGMKMDIPADQIKALKDKKMFDALTMKAADYTAVEKVSEGGKNYYVLVSAKGKTYYDAATGLLYKGPAEMGEMKILEYKTFDGIQVPVKMEVSAMGQKIDVNTTEVLINQGVSEADFK